MTTRTSSERGARRLDCVTWPLLALAAYGLGLALLQATALASEAGLGVAAAGALLLFSAPGLALAALLSREAVQRAWLGAALGLALAVLLGLGFVWTPLRLERGQIALLWGVLTLLLALAAWRWAPALLRGAGGRWLLPVTVLLLALALRLAGAARNELMGDEAKVLLWATDMLQGRTEIIFLHRKGPAEIVLTALHYGLLGRMTALAARLPMAWASALGAVALALLARDLFGSRAGWVAGLVAAVDGFMLGFGHVLQYPNLVLCLGCGAVWLGWRWVADGEQRLASGAALLLGGVALCHWDALWYAAPLAWLALAGLVRGRLGWRPWLRGAAALLGGLALAAGGFYLPYLFGPRAAAIRYYLTDRVAGSEIGWRNNLTALGEYALVYNAAPYALALGLAALAGAVLILRRVRLRRRWQRWLWLATALAALPAALLVDPGDRASGLLLWALALASLAVAMAPLQRASDARDDPLRRLGQPLVLLWLLLPLAAYGLVIKKPLLSVYNIIPGAALAAALAIDRLLTAARRRPYGSLLTGGLSVALLAVWLLACSYATLVFADVDREYIRSYPRAREPLYAWPYRDALPPNAGVGFAHRAGWETIGGLYATGELDGTYWSNEEELITHWYTRGAIRCLQSPRYVFVADNVKDVQEAMPDLSAYRPVGRVRGSDASGIAVWLRRDVAAAPDLARPPETPFAALTTPDLFTGRPRFDLQGVAQQPLAADLSGALALRGFTLADAAASPAGAPSAGDTVELRVHFEVLTPGPHLANAAIKLQQGAGTFLQQELTLGCGLLSTEDWHPGFWYISRHGLELPAALAPGWYRVTLGAYLLQWDEGRLVPQMAEVCLPDRGACGERVTVAKLRVGDGQPAAAAEAVDATFGEPGSIALRGYDLTLRDDGGSAAEQLDVRLHWQALAPPQRDWTVFVHLVDAAGDLVAQHDGPPEGGLNPSSTWVAGEWVLDEHTLALPRDLPAGGYTLWAGLYDAASGQRLTVVGGDAVELATLTLGNGSAD